MGEEGEPSANFPLAECQGHCDVDTDCKVRLLIYGKDWK